MNIFEVATRTKLRFNYKGLLSVEDLWDFKVEVLDTIYKSLNSQLKKSEEESLLGTKTAEDEELTLQIEIIKHIVSVKLQEDAIRLNAAKVKQEKQKLLELLADKKDEDLKKLSAEELQKRIEELNKL